MCTLKHKKVKIRKSRYCVGCMHKFTSGTEMIYYVGIVQGDFQTSYWCKCCDAYYAKYQEDLNDTMGEGDFRNEPHYLEFKKQFENQ